MRIILLSHLMAFFLPRLFSITQQRRCFDGYVVGVRLIKWSPYHSSPLIIGVSKTHPKGCIVGDYIHEWSDIAYLAIDVNRSVCDKGNHIQFEYRPFSRLATFPIEPFVLVVEWIYRSFVKTNIDGIVVSRDIENGCLVDSGGVRKLYPWWAIADILRVTDGTRLPADYCKLLPCLKTLQINKPIVEEDVIDDGHY